MIPKLIVVHHTASSPDIDIVTLNEYHRAKFGLKSSLGYYIGYHRFIAKNGHVWRFRLDTEIGAHSPPNDGAIGICLAGNFMTDKPTEAQIVSLLTLLDEFKERYNITTVLGHRDRNNTLCPGSNLYTFIQFSELSFLERVVKYLKNALNSDIQPV